MRPFEWLFFLSFLPALLLPLFSRTGQQRRRLVFAALLPLCTGLPHLLIEGWRTQMLILYALAVAVGVIRLYALRGTGTARRRPDLFVSSLLLLALVFGGLLPGWGLPIVDLPAPTGPYKVGIVDRELVDSTRGRKLMVSIWYPATQSGPPAKLTDYPDAIASGLAASYGLPIVAPALQHLRYLNVAASKGVPVAGDDKPFPVLVFSHGLVGSRLQNSSSMQELASWGYVVVAVDHTDAAAVTVFPDGETRLFDLQRFGISPADIENSAAVLLPVWVADQRFVYDRLEAWVVDDPLLAGKLDLQRIGSFGHSFGGATSLEVCQVDRRCRAAANLDGGIGSNDTAAALRPLMLMTSTSSNTIAEANRHWTRLVNDATAPAYWLELPGSNHLSFTIFPVLTPLLVPPGSDARASLRTVDRYVRAFFDLYLKGKATPRLDPDAGETDIRWHSR